MSGPVVGLTIMKFLADLGDVIEEHSKSLWHENYESAQVKVAVGETIYVYYEEGWQIGE